METYYTVETDLGRIYVDKKEFEDIKYRVNNVNPWNEDLDGNPVYFHEEEEIYPNEKIIVGSPRLKGSKKITEKEAYKLLVMSKINEFKNSKGITDQTNLILDELIKEIS